MRLSNQQKLNIAKHKAKHPKLTVAELAEKFNVSYDQAYRAIKQFEKGELDTSKIKVKPKKANEIMSETEPDDLLKKQFHKALADLEANDKMAIDDRIELLKKLANTQKTFQTISLQNHLKRVDAEVIANIIRRYQPNASDDDVIVIYTEEKERWQASQA